MKTICKATAAIVVLGTLTLINGCQTAGKVVSTETSTVCPQCETQTVTTPIKGLTYKKHACPLCKNVETEEPGSGAMASYTSSDIKTVHVCKNCSSVVEPCPACTAK